MSYLYVTEYADIRHGCLHEPPIARQRLAISGSSNASVAFNANTKLVRLEADADCRFQFGDAPVADTSSALLAAGQEALRVVERGLAQTLKVAVVSTAAFSAASAAAAAEASVDSGTWFTDGATVAPGGGSHAHGGVFNPSGSGKTIWVHSLQARAQGSNLYGLVGIHDVPGDYATVNRSGRAIVAPYGASSTGQFRARNGTYVPPTVGGTQTVFRNENLIGITQPQVLDLPYPIKVEPGYGLVYVCSVSVQTVYIAANWREE